jgi:hypothetical protein
VDTQIAPLLGYFRKSLIGIAFRARNNPSAGGHNIMMMYTM